MWLLPANPQISSKIYKEKEIIHAALSGFLKVMGEQAEFCVLGVFEYNRDNSWGFKRVKARGKHEREYDCQRKNNSISAGLLNCSGQFWEYCYSQKDPSGGYIIPPTLEIADINTKNRWWFLNWFHNRTRLSHKRTSATKLVYSKMMLRRYDNKSQHGSSYVGKYSYSVNPGSLL